MAMVNDACTTKVARQHQGCPANIVHCGTMDDVCTTKVARDFVRVNEKRRKYFGQFSI
jgi:hypothetical protein